jgi:hypothetical protein
MKIINRLILNFCLHTLLLSIFFGGLNISSAQVEVKANLPLAAFLIPNIGVEFQVGKKTSVQLDVLGSFWDSIDGEPFQLTQTFVEFRYYKNDDTNGWFIGGHLGFGMFTMQKPYEILIYDEYSDQSNPDFDDYTHKSGRAVFHGITFGYKKRFNERWALEAFLGGGYSMSMYKGYNGSERIDLDGGNYKDFNGSGEIAPYRGGLMLTYQLRPYQSK